MPDKVFIDSNVLIYAYSIDEPQKQQVLKGLLDTHEKLVISTQTINEFISVAIKKKRLDSAMLPVVINDFFSIFLVEIIDQAIIQKAIALAARYRYSYFDSLMLASALTSDCSVLYSEDMHHNHVIEKTLQIVNPFDQTRLQ